MAAVKSLHQAHTLLSQGQTKVATIVNRCLENIRKRDNLNAFINVREESEIVKDVEASQKRYDEGKPMSGIDGLPIAIKDNIFVKDMECTAASLILKGFKAPIDATVV